MKCPADCDRGRRRWSLNPNSCRTCGGGGFVDPMSDAEVDASLRAFGYDPKAVGNKMARIAAIAARKALGGGR